MNSLYLGDSDGYMITLHTPKGEFDLYANYTSINLTPKKDILGCSYVLKANRASLLGKTKYTRIITWYGPFTHDSALLSITKL